MRNSPIDLTDLSLVEAYKDWLANEASPQEAYWHRRKADAAYEWRNHHNARVAMRRALNRPW